MKRLLLTMMLLSTPAITMAEEIDLEKSKGTDQEVISSLSPTAASCLLIVNFT